MPEFHQEKKVGPIEPLSGDGKSADLSDKIVCLASIGQLQKRVAELEHELKAEQEKVANIRAGYAGMKGLFLRYQEEMERLAEMMEGGFSDHLRENVSE